MTAGETAPLTRMFLYDAQGSDREVSLIPGLLDMTGQDVLLWIDITGRDPNDLQGALGIVPLDQRSITALAAADPPARVDNYGTYQQFSVLPATTDECPADASPDASEGRLDFIVGENWVVTVHDCPLAYLREFRAQDKADTRTGALSAQAFSASLLDWHLEAYFREVARIEALIDLLDERALAEPASEQLPGRILAVRRHISRLRRRLAAQRPVFYGLVRPDVAAQSPNDSQEPYALLNQRYERAIDEIERTRELVLSSFELLSSRINQSTNELVKALTFFTVVIGIVGAMAGMFGMNFDPPFFHSGWVGFIAATGSLISFALGALAFARFKRWI